MTPVAVVIYVTINRWWKASRLEGSERSTVLGTGEAQNGALSRVIRNVVHDYHIGGRGIDGFGHSVLDRRSSLKDAPGL